MVTGRSRVVPLWRPNDVEDVTFLTGLLDTGAVKPVADRVYPLTEAQRALQPFGASRHIGKIVLTMQCTAPDGPPCRSLRGSQWSCGRSAPQDV